MTSDTSVFVQIAEYLQEAEAMVIIAGSGMSASSGLPELISDKQFWDAFPEFEQAGIHLAGVNTPAVFQRFPELGWGFYATYLDRIRQSTPHPGYACLQSWTQRYQLPYFVETSNVEGQFMAAGFQPERTSEIHGAVHALQCSRNCLGDIWSLPEGFDFQLHNLMAKSFPVCPHCGEPARPNVCLLADTHWARQKSIEQARNFECFLFDHREKQMLVLELGASPYVPSLRTRSERLGRTFQQRTKVVRINKNDARIQAPHLSAQLSPLDALLGTHKFVLPGM
ncbi:MAG: Sir2 family NAD-dependent protein deacetylase [Bacteroidota bacterium]